MNILDGYNPIKKFAICQEENRFVILIAKAKPKSLPLLKFRSVTKSLGGNRWNRRQESNCSLTTTSLSLWTARAGYSTGPRNLRRMHHCRSTLTGLGRPKAHSRAGLSMTNTSGSSDYTTGPGPGSAICCACLIQAMGLPGNGQNWGWWRSMAQRAITSPTPLYSICP